MSNKQRKLERLLFSAGSTMLLIISNHLSSRPRSELCTYKSTELNLIFIEFLNLNEINVIVGCIYRHPDLDLNKFNAYHVNNLLGK